MDINKLTHLLQTMYSMSDEQLLEEFENTEKEIKMQAGSERDLLKDPQGYQRLLVKLEREYMGEGDIQL